MKENTRKTFRFFWGYVKRHKIAASAMLFGLLLGSIMGMVWVMIFREFFAILEMGGEKAVVSAALMVTLGWIIFSEALEWIGWRIVHYVDNWLRPQVMSEIVQDCFEYMHQHSYRFFTNNFVGSLVKKVGRIMRGFERVIGKIYWDMVPMTTKVLFILGVLTWLHPMLGAIMGAWVVVFVYIQYRLSKFKLKYDVPRAAMDSKVTAALADSITNNSNVKLFAALKFEMKRFGRVLKRWFKATKISWDIDAHIESGQAAFMILLEFVILYVAIKLWERDLIVLADFFVIQAYLFELFHQLWNLGRNLREMYEALADSEEMTVILNTPLEVADVGGAAKLRITRGEVEYMNVHFAYGDSEDVLRGLSFKIKPGEKIALIGPSGGGKSTIVKLLLRLFDIQKGQILIDGQNIAEVTQDSLREQIALVPQDPILFHRSLMDNIRYGRRGASDKEVMAAAKMAHCHEFIQNFPKKYDTFVGERGVKLSGGQRQRVAIARAILSNAGILVLDEATSSLDSESEVLIQEALDNLMKQKTTFIIAHRLSTIMRADRIFVLNGGNIVEEGQHADLVGMRGGLYKKLWNLQVGGYL